MKIRAGIGNPNTGEWEKSFYIELVPYIEFFSQEHPGLEAYKGIEDQFAVKGYEINIANQSTVELEVHHHVPRNSVSIFVKHNGESFVQAMGHATEGDLPGLSLLFIAPGCSAPVELVCEPS